MKSIVAGMLAGVMLLTATPALAAEESAEQVAVTAAKPLSTEQRIADLENELKELKAMYTKDKTVQAKKDKDAADRLQFKGKVKLEQEWDSKGDKALSSKKNKVQIDLEQQGVFVGAHFAKAGDPLHRLPIGNLAVIQACPHKH